MGIFDPQAADLLTLLCGETPATAIETSSRLTLLAEPGTLALVGPHSRLETKTVTLAGPGRLQLTEPSQVVVYGHRAVLATPGGWQPPLPFGAANCQSCTSGQKLVANRAQTLSTVRLDTHLVAPAPALVLRIVGGSELPGEWQVLPASDRRGVRLIQSGRTSGPPGLEVSRPCFTGTCQLTPDGTLLIHGPDGPTLGGYHQAGQVALADLGVLAQIKPGDPVTIQPITVHEAIQAEEERRLRWQRAAQLISLTL